jgi:hypothetical protein
MAITRRNHLQKQTLTVMLLFFMTGCVTNPPIDRPPKSDEKQHFKKTVTIKDHPSQAVVTFSTVKGFQEKHSTDNVVWDDNFLRGFIDKKTKAKTYQVYNVIYYAGSGTDFRWKHFNQAKYQTPEGDKSTPTTLIKKHEDCTAIQFHGQCLYSEHIIFKIDGELLRLLAKSYALNTPKERTWQYQLISESGENRSDKLQIAEMAGLLEKMDEYIIQKTTAHLGDKEKEPLPVPSLTPEPLIKPPSAKVLLPLILK